ncbi:MAG: omptin family outer membrane protease [Spirochaetaceae bacterium]|jgi:outer membrane protease|nr:omptin family outer membrane protease [Spirochaetaceae bacterium]GMO30133.1 MAG: hypothetical protein Pg6A_18940 [Termitinemataceae bacterium]
MNDTHSNFSLFAIRAPRFSVLFCIVIIFFCRAPKLFSQDAEQRPLGRYALRFSSGAGVFLGNTSEIVYWDKKADDYLSCLTWQLMPVFYLSASVEFSPLKLNNGFYTELNGRAGLPSLNSGVMQDKDWADPSEKTRLTNFSEHTNRTLGAALLSLRTGWSYCAGKYVVLKPYLNFNYDYFSFSAQDGYRRYESEGWEKKNFYGEVISFTQMFVIVSPGIKLNFILPASFYFDIFYDLGLVVFYYDEDNHLLTDVQFKDITFNGISVNSGIKFSYRPFERFSFDLNFTYNYIGLIRGESISRPQNNGKWEESGIFGAGLSLFEIGLSLTIIH